MNEGIPKRDNPFGNGSQQSSLPICPLQVDINGVTPEHLFKLSGRCTTSTGCLLNPANAGNLLAACGALDFGYEVYFSSSPTGEGNCPYRC